MFVIQTPCVSTSIVSSHFAVCRGFPRDSLLHQGLLGLLNVLDVGEDEGRDLHEGLVQHDVNDKLQVSYRGVAAHDHQIGSDAGVHSPGGVSQDFLQGGTDPPLISAMKSKINFINLFATLMKLATSCYTANSYSSRWILK